MLPDIHQTSPAKTASSANSRRGPLVDAQSACGLQLYHMPLTNQIFSGPDQSRAGRAVQIWALQGPPPGTVERVTRQWPCEMGVEITVDGGSDGNDKVRISYVDIGAVSLFGPKMFPRMGVERACQRKCDET